MEKVDIWYFSDNSSSDDISDQIKKAGLDLNIIKSFQNESISSNNGNIFIIDVSYNNLSELVDLIKDDDRLAGGQKYILVHAKDIDCAARLSSEILNLEFLDKNIDGREFAILIEKTAIIEKYKLMMKSFSREAEDRLEAYQSLIKVHKQYPFESDSQKTALEKIIKYEKNLVDEQRNLNDAIKEFTIHHQKSLFELKNVLDAEEMLDSLRSQEMIYANDTIKAQQSVIEFSAQEIAEREKIFEAQERTYELSREESLALHAEVKRLRTENEKLKAELSKYISDQR
ncbi:MAG: hypothetical protein KA015_03290 [Spirochaetes bacterium]|nr:hypothetical protein [Spirochaetota bacterium]